jgi:hypothetical protein
MKYLLSLFLFSIGAAAYGQQLPMWHETGILVGNSDGYVTEVLSFGNDSAIVVYSDWSIFLSSDDGKTWSDTKASVPSTGVSFMTENGTFLHAGYYPYGWRTGGLSSSEDFGRHWHQIFGDTAVFTKFIKGKGKEIFAIRNDSSYSSTSYFYPSTLCHSSDEGQTWAPLYTGFFYDAVVRKQDIFLPTYDSISSVIIH